MKKAAILLMIMISLILGLTGCQKTSERETSQEIKAEVITAEEAKEIMDEDTDYIVLDVREQSEYEEGHIADAVLIPHTEIEDRAEEELPEKDQLILVYCRSGNRSAAAAKTLTNMGYTNVRDFGGIKDWLYDVVTD